MSEPRTHELDVPGAVLRYDVLDVEAENAEPLLLMIAAPDGRERFHDPG
jgi:hypothetical protein